jgi:hypothetical protein
MYKLIDKEVCKLYNIDKSSIITGPILGSAVLCDVKLYQSKKELAADQSKHYGFNVLSNYKYGFLVCDARRFDISKPSTHICGSLSN